MTSFFKIFLVFILTKPDLVTTKIILYKGLYKFWKKSISFRGAAIWKEIEQSLKTLPHVTLRKQYKDCLLNYE